MNASDKVTMPLLLSSMGAAITLICVAVAAPIFVLDRMDTLRSSLEDKIGGVGEQVYALSKDIQSNRMMIENGMQRMGDSWSATDMKTWVQLLKAQNEGIKVPPVE